jgi:Ca2+-binding RTX toxin-like protein
MRITNDARNISGADESETTVSDLVVANADPIYFSPWAANTPYRPYQWYLDGYLTPNSNVNGANIDSISAEYSGLGVKIGVIDNGFDTSNIDLAGRFDLALSFDPRDSGTSIITPDNASHTHGTWVSGVIGANGENDVGTVGVAPEAVLVGYYMRFGFGGSSLAETSNLLARQIDVDISNSSWGYTTAFVDNFLDPIFAEMKNGITAAVEEGRDGLGTIYVFAAGNDRQYLPNSITSDGDNTNHHSLTNNRFTITVAGCEQDGDVTTFSTPGASILVTAPAQWIATTTPTDGDGNPADDFGFVTGTSFAAPIVSGVIALMLEANPNLGYRDVQEILALSARKVDPTSTSWAENGATNWNGGSNLVSHDFGFGLVDAHAAVRLAETWTSAHTAANEAMISVEGHVDAAAALIGSQPNPYVATVSAAHQDFSIDWVEIDISLLHTHIGDLRIELISPTGTHSVLMNRSMAGNNPKDNLTFTFSTVHDWGESPVGDWSLLVADEGGGGTGSMVSFALRFYGDDEGQNDTYYYTDEFATLTGDRAILADASGVDTVNAAAVTSNLLLDLTPGATLTIAGREVTSQPGTLIENAFAGDGADILVGNAADNHLWGGAADDTLAGHLGNDTLVGGAGADLFIYVAGDGADTIADYSAAKGDRIDLTGAHVATLSGLRTLATQGGAATVIDFGDGGLLTLSDVNKDALDGSGFLFAIAHAPTAVTLSNDVAVADGPIGTVVASLSTADADLGETFSYQLLDDHGGLFSIDGRNLVLIGSLSAGQSYEIAIHVIDAEGHTIDESFSIVALELHDLIVGRSTGGHTYFGGSGDDIYYVTDGDDVILEADGNGDDAIYAGVSYTLPDAIEILLLLEGAGAIDGTGNDAANTITGNSAANRLDGGTGADSLYGGAGDDVYVVDSSGDSVVEQAGEGIDTVVSAIRYALGAELENLTLAANAGSIDGTGNELDNTITGNAAGNVLDGGAGADTMAGKAGNDSYLVDDADDRVVELAGEGTDTVHTTVTYTLAAEVENLVLAAGAGAIDGTGNDRDNVITGNASANVIGGGAGNDTMIGGAGADTMVGGAGNDGYFVDNAGDRVIEAAGEGIDTVHAAISYVLGAEVENLVLLANAIAGTGNDLDNLVTGNASDNIMDGALGADVMAGSAGSDTYYVENAGDIVIENANEGVDTVRAAVSYALSANVENLILAAGAMVATGNDLDNTITGNASGNTINGAAGADTMIGGSGNDLYLVDNAGDLVTESAAEGFDTVLAAISYALTADVENLILAPGAGAINGTGNGLDNRIAGNAGNNALDGGGGTDTVDYSSTQHGIAVDLSAHQAVGSEIGIDGLVNVENVIGGAGHDTLAGDSAANLLDGGAGADTMIGRSGDDHYIVDDLGDVVIESADEGHDLVTAWIDFTLGSNFEALILGEGAGDIKGTGNGADNSLIGNSGDNVLDGAGGADYMAGGAGSDVYFVDSAADIVIESADGGNDIVYAFIDYEVPDNVEMVILVGAAQNLSFAPHASGLVPQGFSAVAAEPRPHTGIGNLLGNLMVGSAGNDTFFAEDGLDSLFGGAGDDVLVSHSAAHLFAQEADSLSGGDGNDTIYADAFDTISGGAGFDVLQVINAYDMNIDLVATGFEYVVSEFGNDTYTAASGSTAVEVYGSGGNDSITGGSGNDRLWGGVGNDILVGNAGADVLVGDLGADSLSGGDGNDVLYIDTDDTLIDGGAGFDAAYISGGAGITLNMTAANLEWVADFVNGNDTITAAGTSANVEIYGAGGNDNLTGGSGNDLIFAGTGDDVLLGGDGNDALVGGEGADSLSGGAGNDRLYIGSSDTSIDGGTGFDAAYIVDGGGTVLDMAASNLEFVTDLVAGNDTIDASSTSAGVRVFAGGGTDTILGGSGADTLWAGSGNDLLVGNAGDDTLVGEAGQDRLVGGAGFDLFYGGADADRFVYTTGGGTDTVSDWQDGIDVLEFNQVAGIDDFNDLTIVDNGGNAEIFFGSDKLLVVVGAASHIDSHDFFFV